MFIISSLTNNLFLLFPVISLNILLSTRLSTSLPAVDTWILHIEATSDIFTYGLWNNDSSTIFFIS